MFGMLAIDAAARAFFLISMASAGADLRHTHTAGLEGGGGAGGGLRVTRDLQCA